MKSIRDWSPYLDPPTLRATRRIGHELYKLRESLRQRLLILENRSDKLNAIADEKRPWPHPEDDAATHRLIKLCSRTARAYEEIEWRIKQLEQAESIIEEIESSVSDTRHRAERGRRARRAAKVDKPADVM